MKRGALLFTILFSFHTVFAQDPYFKVSLGVSSISDKEAKSFSISEAATERVELEYESAMSINTALGLDYDNGNQLELCFSTRENEGNGKQDSSDKFDQKSNAIGVNLIRELRASNVVPYVNAGLGVIFTEFKAEGEKFDDTSRYINVGAGIRASISDTLEVYGHYEYYICSDFKYTRIELNQDILDIELELGLHQFVVGITQSF